MNRKIVLTTVLLGLALVWLQSINLSEANFLFPPNSLPHIHIKSDGNVEPSTAPISRTRNVYTLTANITGYTLEVECDNVVIDGAGYTISSDNKSSPAISIGQRSNITIKNLCIALFCSAHISMGGATNCTITNTTIFTVAGGAMTLNGCNNCTITNNTFHNADLLYDDGRGESVYCGGNDNIISGNNFLGGEVGLVIYGSDDTVINNTFTGTKKYLSVSRTEPHTIENNTVNGIIISEAPYVTPSPNPTVTQMPTNSPTPAIAPSPSSTLTPIQTFTSTPFNSPSPATSPVSPSTTAWLQPTTTLSNQQVLPAELIYITAIATVIIIIAVVTVILKKG